MCPLIGQCLTDNIVYQAEVDVESLPIMYYIGLTEDAFKRRYSNCVTSFSCPVKIYLENKR